jgi:hypothetical protein
MVSIVLGDVDPDHFGQYSCQFLGPLSLHKVPSSGQRAANDEVKLALLLATNYVSDGRSSHWTKSLTISSMMCYTE